MLGFPLCNVFELVDDDPNKYLPADEIEKHLGKEVNVLGYLIVTKPVRTIKNDTMYFQLSLMQKVIGLMLFAFLKPRFVILLQEKGFIAMKGKVVEEFRVFTVEVHYCMKVGIKERGQKGNELVQEKIK